MLVLLLAGCLSVPDDSPTTTFEFVWDEFDRRYGGFDQRGLDWDAAWDTWRPQVSDGMTDDALWEVLTGLLQTTDDGHVKLASPDREVFEANHVYRDDLLEGTFDDELIASQYLANPDRGPWDWYLYGHLADDLPYIWFPGIDDNTHLMDQIADDNPDATALIIDLRQSHGGNYTWALHGLGRLAETDTYAWRSRSRIDDQRGTFSEWREWDLPARDPYWEVPIFLLTDEITISASERVAMMLQALPNTTTIGSPTNGSQATMIGREAPNRWTFSLPTQEVEAWDGEVYEGVGLPVDILLRNDPDDVDAGTDAVLERAIAEAAALR
jgi:hypothetical protein